MNNTDKVNMATNSGARCTSTVPKTTVPTQSNPIIRPAQLRPKTSSTSTLVRSKSDITGRPKTLKTVAQNAGNYKTANAETSTILTRTNNPFYKFDANFLNFENRLAKNIAIRKEMLTTYRTDLNQNKKKIEKKSFTTAEFENQHAKNIPARKDASNKTVLKPLTPGDKKIPDSRNLRSTITLNSIAGANNEIHNITVRNLNRSKSKPLINLHAKPIATSTPRIKTTLDSIITNPVICISPQTSRNPQIILTRATLGHKTNNFSTPSTSKVIHILSSPDLNKTRISTRIKTLNPKISVDEPVPSTSGLNKTAKLKNTSTNTSNTTKKLVEANRNTLKSAAKPGTSKPAANFGSSKSAVNPGATKFAAHPAATKLAANPGASKFSAGTAPSKPTANPGPSKSTANPGCSKPAANVGTLKSATNPGTAKAAANPGVSKSTANPGTAKAAANPGTSKVAANPGTSKAAANPGTSKAAANPGTSKAAANPGTSKPAASPGTSKSAANSVTLKSATNHGTLKPGANPGTSKPTANPGTSKAAANPGCSKSAANAGTSAANRGTLKPATNPGASKFTANPGSSKSATNFGTLKSATNRGALNPFANPGTSKPVANPGATKFAANPGASKLSAGNLTISKFKVNPEPSKSVSYFITFNDETSSKRDNFVQGSSKLHIDQNKNTIKVRPELFDAYYNGPNTLPSKLILKIEPSKKDPDVIIIDDQPSTSKATENHPFYYKLLEIFPDICPLYLKKFCAENTGPTTMDYLISVLLDANYMKRNMPESPEGHLVFEEQYQILQDLFPDADPTYLQHHCERLIDQPDALEDFVTSLVESKTYPTKEEYLKKMKLSAQEKQYTTEFDVKKFLEVIPNPEEFFNDPKRQISYSNYDENTYAVTFLKNTFYFAAVKDITHIFRETNCSVLRSAKALESLRNLKNKRQPYPVTSCKNIPLLQEIAYVKHKKEIESYIEIQKLEKIAIRKKAKESGLMKTCQCCYDDEVMPNEILSCESVLHIFCKECVRRGCEVIIGEGKLDFPCLETCNSKFSLQVLQAVLTPKVFSKMAQRKQMEEVKSAGIEDLEFCPFCDFATIPAPTDKLFRCLNDDCMKESCRLCKEPSHIPFRCNEVEKDEDVKLRTYIENKMTEALLRKCYKCGLKFIKESGCNKMTCSCGAMMCYVCNQPVQDYKHFNGQGGDQTHLCPLFSDTHKLHMDAIKKGAENAKKEMGVDKEKALKIDPTADIENHYRRLAALNPAIPNVHNVIHPNINNVIHPNVNNVRP